MKDGINKLKSLLVSPNIFQIIIPEIQRDYVWTEENISKFILSIIEDSSSVDEIDESIIKSLKGKLKESILREIRERKPVSNIGFIYAYYDPELRDRYFLIDGQQRITTIYLLLLALSIKENKQEYFRKIYFSNNNPKIDYKVREKSHDFFINFISFVLNGGNASKAKQEYWFFSEYYNDMTISNLVKNYICIEDIIQHNPLTLEYIENSVELWYFDTYNSTQGEELYIYMNSRGESAQPYENIKALLMVNRSENDKNKWGTDWEHWQGFFWKHRKAEDKNADNGFNEFLKWVQIIEFNIIETNKNQNERGDYIRNLRITKNISTDYLSFEIIEKYFLALEKIKNSPEYLYFQDRWLYADTDATDYIKLLPILLYSGNNNQAEPGQLNRFARFFFNVSRLVEVRKNSPNNAANAILLTQEFLKKDYIDIIELISMNNLQEFNTILTNEEVFKLSLFKDPPDGYTREDIEKTIWKVEDSPLLLGSISFILYCLDFNVDEGSGEHLNFKRFINISNHFEALFTKPTDLLRRALLTFGNYSIYDGYSPTLELSRYCFGNNIEDWRKIINEDNRENASKNLLLFFEKEWKSFTQNDYEIKLNDLILDYSKNNTISGNWKYYFVVYKEVFEYCWQKRACLGEDGDIILLQGIKVTPGTHVDINDLIKKITVT